jgi:hypothetical protein
MIERVQVLMRRCIIRCMRTVPQVIIQAEFMALPLRIESIFGFVSLLHWVHGYADSLANRDHYPYLAYYFSEAIATINASGWGCCWFAEVTCLLQLVGISMDHLPPFRYSLNSSNRILLTKKELNKIIREDIFKQFIQVTLVDPPRGLNPKMAFYAEYFMKLRYILIVWPSYTLRHWVHALRIPLGQFRVGSHRLWIEIGHHMLLSS